MPCSIWEDILKVVHCVTTPSVMFENVDLEEKERFICDSFSMVSRSPRRR